MSNYLSATSSYFLSSSLLNAGESLYNSGQAAAALHTKTSRCREVVGVAQSIIGLPGRARDAISAPIAWVAGKAISYCAQPLYVNRAEKFAEKTIQTMNLEPKFGAACEAVASTSSAPYLSGTLLSFVGDMAVKMGQSGQEEMEPNVDLGNMGLARRFFSAGISAAAIGVGTLSQVTGSILESTGGMAAQLGGNLTGHAVRNKLKAFYLDKVKEAAHAGITRAVQVAVINPLLIREILAHTPDQIKSTIASTLELSDTAGLGIMGLQGAYYLLAFGPCVWSAAKVSWAYFNRASQVAQVKQSLADFGLPGVQLDAGVLALLEMQSYALSHVTDNSEGYVQQLCNASTYFAPALASTLGFKQQ